MLRGKGIKKRIAVLEDGSGTEDYESGRVQVLDEPVVAVAFKGHASAAGLANVSSASLVQSEPVTVAQQRAMRCADMGVARAGDSPGSCPGTSP